MYCLELFITTKSETQCIVSFMAKKEGKRLNFLLKKSMKIKIINLFINEKNTYYELNIGLYYSVVI